MGVLLREMVAMTIDELKSVLHDIISKYFQDTQIVWAEQLKLVKPSLPFILLKLRNLRFTQHTINVVKNGVPCAYQPSQTMLELQLFTRGGTVTIEDEDGESVVSVNTALNDIMDLTKYLTSEYADELYEKYDICIRAEGEAQDVSEVVDTNYEYRAFQEYIIDFQQTCNGRAGISRKDWSPTASGGGTKELAESEIGEITKVSIENKT